MMVFGLPLVMLAAKKPRILTTRTHLLPVPGHAPPGSEWVPPLASVYTSVPHLLVARRHSNSSMSKTAMGTIRGLIGPHDGTQPPWTLGGLVEDVTVAPGSRAVREARR